MAFVAGAAAGAAIALLLAPDSGEKTREKLTGKVLERLDVIEAALEKL